MEKPHWRKSQWLPRPHRSFQKGSPNSSSFRSPTIEVHHCESLAFSLSLLNIMWRQEPGPALKGCCSDGECDTCMELRNPSGKKKAFWKPNASIPLSLSDLLFKCLPSVSASPSLIWSSSQGDTYPQLCLDITSAQRHCTRLCFVFL